MRQTSAGSIQTEDPGHQDREFEEKSEGVNISRLLAAMRRQAGVFVLFCLLGLVAGGGYVLTAVPKFTAGTNILIDNRQVRAGQDVSSVADNSFDSGAVDNQV